MFDIGNQRKIEIGWYNLDPGRYMSVIVTKHIIQAADRQIKTCIHDITRIYKLKVIIINW